MDKREHTGPGRRQTEPGGNSKGARWSHDGTIGSLSGEPRKYPKEHTGSQKPRKPRKSRTHKDNKEELRPEKAMGKSIPPTGDPETKKTKKIKKTQGKTKKNSNQR